MTSTAQILEAAKKLGTLICEHDAAQKLEKYTGQLRNDTESQRALNDLNRHIQAIAEKESAKKPIEVEDKRKLEALQKSVVSNELLRTLQLAQMDYVDLLRQVDDAIAQESPNITVNPDPPHDKR